MICQYYCITLSHHTLCFGVRLPLASRIFSRQFFLTVKKPFFFVKKSKTTKQNKRMSGGADHQDFSWYFSKEKETLPMTNMNPSTSPYLKNTNLNNLQQSAASNTASPQMKYQSKLASVGASIDDDTMKSKAVLSALRSLQEKIAKLQEDNALLRDAVDSEKFQTQKQKQEYDNQLAMGKIEFMKEKEIILAEKESKNTELRITKEKLASKEREVDNSKAVLGTQDLDKKSYNFQTNTLSDQLKVTEEAINHKNDKIRELEDVMEKGKTRIEEFELRVLKERRKRSRLASEKKAIEQAFKEIVQVHQSVMENKVEVILKKKPKPKRDLSIPKYIRDKVPIPAGFIFMLLPFFS